MAEKKEIEFLYKQSMRKSDFAGLDEDCVAALALLSFAISELNFFLRQYLFVRHQFDGPSELQSINFFQHNVLLRTISAKLFEASEFVMLEGKYNKTKSAKLQAMLLRFQKSFRHLKKHPGYTLVRSLRHETTNHYKLKSARANIRSLPSSADFSFYHHDMQGNCYYPMGETVMHYGRVLRHSEELSVSPVHLDRSEFDLWMHWNIAALKWLRRVHTHIALSLVHDGLPEKSANKIMLWLPEGASAVPQERLTPFFARPDKSNHG